jgi:hypothetical protein
MSKRLEVRLPEKIDRILVLYCEESGATRTGAIVMLIRSLEKKLTLESQQLLANMEDSDAVN